MNVEKHFQTMTEADCRKRYPKGYFAAVEKNAKGGGMVLLVMGVIAAPIGFWLFLVLVKFFLKEGMNSTVPMTAGDIVGSIFFFLIPLLVFLFGVFCLWLGIRRFKSTGAEWFQLTVEQSSYTESELLEFDRQVSRPGTVTVILSEKGQPGALLTEDYFVLEPGVPMRFEDIKGVYQVDYPEMVYTGKTMKTIPQRNLAVFSDRGTFSRAHAKPEIAQRVQAMLLEKNREIDTADGGVLTDREYDEMEKTYIEKQKN